HIPGEPEPRLKQFVIFLHSGVAWKTGVAGIVETGWSVLEDGALDSLLESTIVEVVGTLVVHDFRQVWLPAKSIVHRQSRRHLPGVLNIKANVVTMRQVQLGTIFLEAV